MYMHGMGDSSNPAETDYLPPLTFVDAPTPDQLAITNQFPVVTMQAPTLTNALSTPVIAGFTGKQLLIGAGALLMPYLLLKRK